MNNNSKNEKFYEKFTEKKSGKKGKDTKKKSDKSKSEINSKSTNSRSTSNQNSSKINSRPKSTFTDKSSVNSNYKIIKSQFGTENLPADSKYVLENFDEIIQGVRPLNSRQLQQLPDNIKELSHQLTDDRASRRLGYMNENVQLSAYVRYYTWWNLVRLTRLFSNFSTSQFPSKDCVCLDLGSGPLTVITALWLARPELRKLKLTWYCLDVSSNSMALGEDVYLSVAARCPAPDTENAEPWKIIRVKGSFGTGLKQKADFITCANMFNELDQASDMPPEYQSKKYFDQLINYSSPEANYLLIEPGVPKAARTITLLRERFIKSGKKICSPCPHSENCPMSGFKAYTGSQNKWCNFAFSTEDAPSKLQKLSEKAKLPKERATLCYISVTATKTNDKSEMNSENKTSELLCRVASDPFRLPGNRTGYYACSRIGLTLLSLNKRFDSENPAENNELHSGDLVKVKTKTPDLSALEKDEKSGALKIKLD